MGRNPVTLEAKVQDCNQATPGPMAPSRLLSMESRATTRRRSTRTDLIITDRTFIMVPAGVGEDGGGKDLTAHRWCTVPDAAPRRR
jgi:hypothetical protein